MVNVINSALRTTPLSAEISDIDNEFIKGPNRQTVTLTMYPSCQSEEFPSCQSEDMQFGFSVIGEEPETKIACMDLPADTDQATSPDEDDYILPTCPGEIYGEDGEYFEEEDDEMAFERLMMEYDNDDRALPELQ